MQNQTIAVSLVAWIILLALLALTITSSLRLLVRTGWAGRRPTAKMGWGGLVVAAVALAIALAFLRPG